MDVCLLDIGALEFFDILTIKDVHSSSVSKSERIPLFDGPDLIGTLGTCIPAILTSAAIKIKWIQAHFISYLLSYPVFDQHDTIGRPCPHRERFPIFLSVIPYFFL
jgi:hypothetical protein